jgi:phage replication O-like protein O
MSNSNYTKVYNCFYKLLPCLKESELKIMLIINRQTDGWGKESDRISYSQFQEATGLARITVCLAIRSLKENRFITVKNYKYSINWDVDPTKPKENIDYNFDPDKYVYIIRYDTHVKIGKANNVQKRFSSLKGMSHIKIELLWYANETESINEQSLHDLFNKHRSHNEYFEYSAEIKDFIESHRN